MGVDQFADSPKYKAHPDKVDSSLGHRYKRCIYTHSFSSRNRCLLSTCHKILLFDGRLDSFDYSGVGS